MARSSFTSPDPNTPWWYETPSLASQTTYTQSTFPGASISQLTDPFSPTSEKVPQDRGSDSDSDNEGNRSFLITTVDTDTGQSSFSMGSDFDTTVRQKPKRIAPSQKSYSSSNTEREHSFQSRLRTFSDSSNQRPKLSSSLPKSSQAYRSTTLGSAEQAKEVVSSKEGVTDWLTNASLRGSGREIKTGKVTDAAITPTSSNGVVNFTVNCQIHLHSENGELKRSNSNIELVPTSGTNLPIVLPGTVSMTTGAAGALVKAERDPMDMTLHSTITEEGNSDLLNDRVDSTGADGDCLTPLSLSSECSVESQLTHSMSSANQDVLNYLRPQLMQYLNPDVLLPLLKQHNLLTNEDLKYLSHPKRTEKEKRRRVLTSAAACDFELLVECISSEKTDSGHVYLARRLKEAIEKKRNNPFKRLSSLKGKNRSLSSDKKPTPLSFAKERKHSPHSSATPSPRTPTKPAQRSSLTSTSKRKNSTTNDDPPFKAVLNSTPLKSEESSISYETSTLPRKFESKFKQESRGAKPYSSARFTSMSSAPTQTTPMRSKLARHGSFSGGSDVRVQVTPLLKDPNTISQDNSDALENLINFKTSVFNFPSSSQTSDLLDMTFSKSQNSGRDSLRRDKKVSPYTTIPEAVSETGESPDAVPPMLPVKKRHQARKNYTPLKIGRRVANSSAELSETEPTINENMETMTFSAVDRPRHSSLRGENPQKRTSALKRGTSLYGVTDSPSRHFPLTKYNGQQYMPSALSPDSLSPKSPSSPDEKPPPVPIKQRTHRRTQSYDTSQASIDFSSFATPQHCTRTPKHHSLQRGTPSSMSNYSNASGISDVPSHVPIISTQDSGITNSFDGRVRSSASGYSLATDPGESVSRYSGTTASDLGNDVLTIKKFEWLQERVHFKKTPEELMFSSRTHFNQERMILNSGILYERGRPKFLVLLTDMLLILKPRKKSSALPGKLGSFFSSSQGPVLDWFSDMDCIAKMPLLLHHLSVRSLSKRKEPQVLYLHYDDRSEMVQFTLHSVSKEAKDIWVESLNTAIAACTKAQARTVLPKGNLIRQLPTSPTYTKLTLIIVEANNVAVEVDVKTRNHFCTIQLGEKKCKTPNVKAQCWPSWDYKIEFVDFSLTETVWIEFYTERITSPDEYLGGVDIQLMAVAQRLKVNMTQGVSTLQLKNQHLPLKNGKGTLTLDFELGWVHVEK